MLVTDSDSERGDAQMVSVIYNQASTGILDIVSIFFKIHKHGENSV